MEQKENVIKNLYALRAGLSVISEEYDKAKNVQEICENRLLENADNIGKGLTCLGGYGELSALQEHYGYDEDIQSKFDLEEADYSFDNPEPIEHYNSKMNRIAENNLKARKAYAHWLSCDESDGYFQYLVNDAQHKRDSVAAGDDSMTWGVSYKKDSRLETILSVVFFTIAAALMALLMYAVVVGISVNAFDGWNEKTAEFLTTIIVIAIPLLVFLILGLVYCCKAVNNRASHKQALGEKDDQLTSAQRMLDNLPQFRQNARDILEEKDKKIAPIKESCNEFYFALRKQFNPILDERDWQHLDLIIFELETHRADNLKEALQLVDRELQTERIQSAIAQATKQICHEIRRGFAEMRNTILECSKIISSQLTSISYQLEGVNEHLAELTDSVNMGNALQAKANVTSAQLLNDVHAIRYYQ